MARTVKQIQDAIIAAKNADPVLVGLNSPSKTAVWLLWTYVVAFCQYTLEVLFDLHKAEVQTMLAAGKVHTQLWYVTKAKEFQYGVTLPADTDVYPTITESALIIKQAASEEITRTGVVYLTLKLATGTGPLTAIGSPELAAFVIYMNRIKDAGVRIECISGNGDTLQLITKVYYDPLTIDNTGARIDGTNATPVQSAIDAYLLDMGNNNFNGVLVLNRLIDAVLAVDGVNDFTIIVAQSYYAATLPVAFTASQKPHDGYFLNDAGYFNTNVTYIAST